MALLPKGNGATFFGGVMAERSFCTLSATEGNHLCIVTKKLCDWEKLIQREGFCRRQPVIQKPASYGLNGSLSEQFLYLLVKVIFWYMVLHVLG
jgi:hypothetical protein